MPSFSLPLSPLCSLLFSLPGFCERKTGNPQKSQDNHMKKLSNLFLLFGFIFIFAVIIITAKRLIPVEYNLDLEGGVKTIKERAYPIGLKIDSLGISLPV